MTFDVSQLRQERVQFVETSVNVADDVEWTMIEFAIVPEWLAFDDDGVDFVRSREFVNVPEAFAFEIANGAPQLLTLLADDVWSKVPVTTFAIPILADAII